MENVRNYCIFVHTSKIDNINMTSSQISKFLEVRGLEIVLFKNIITR